MAVVRVIMATTHCCVWCGCTVSFADRRFMSLFCDCWQQLRFDLARGTTGGPRVARGHTRPGPFDRKYLPGHDSTLRWQSLTDALLLQTSNHVTDSLTNEIATWQAALLFLVRATPLPPEIPMKCQPCEKFALSCRVFRRILRIVTFSVAVARPSERRCRFVFAPAKKNAHTCSLLWWRYCFQSDTRVWRHAPRQRPLEAALRIDVIFFVCLATAYPRSTSSLVLASFHSDVRALFLSQRFLTCSPITNFYTTHNEINRFYVFCQVKPPRVIGTVHRGRSTKEGVILSRELKPFEVLGFHLTCWKCCIVFWGSR